MKTLEEIEKLSIEELAGRAAEAAPAAPDGLRERLRTALAAQQLAAEPQRPRPVRWALPAAALATAAAATLLVTLPERGPQDTFDDPYLAYAEVEKAFQTISDKMSDGMQIARKAGSAAEMPQNILNKIQEK